MCRGVSCRRQVHSRLHDLSHQSGAPLVDQGAGNLGDLEHRPLPMLRLLQERASRRERERETRRSSAAQQKITHRHANASDNKNNIAVRRLFLFVLVWTSRVTIAAAFDSSRSFAHQRFEPHQLRHRCLDDFPLRSQLAAAKGRFFCDSRVDRWLVQSTQRKQVLEENIKMQTHGAP